MSKTKQGGSSRLGRDSASQRLGIKVPSGKEAKSGMIIIRQRGTKYLPGKNTKLGSDDTIYASVTGIVKFSNKTKKSYDNSQRTAKIVSIETKK
jgi:large subunit ribosomal protein L27